MSDANILVFALVGLGQFWTIVETLVLSFCGIKTLLVVSYLLCFYLVMSFIAFSRPFLAVRGHTQRSAAVRSDPQPFADLHRFVGDWLLAGLMPQVKSLDLIEFE